MAASFKYWSRLAATPGGEIRHAAPNMTSLRSIWLQMGRRPATWQLSKLKLNETPITPIIEIKQIFLTVGWFH
jgi:hypothetical protein